MRSETGISPDRLGRALTLLYYLLEKGRPDRVPIVDIQRDLGLSLEEIRDDLGLLNLVNSGGGMYVIYAKIEGAHVSVQRELLSDEMAEPARLTPLMAKALLLALDLVGDDLPTDGRASLASARAKIQALFSASVQAGVLETDDLLRPDRRVLHAVNEALRERRLLRLDYYTRADEELRERIVEPYLLHRSKDTWYLDGFCRTAGSRRTFRLDLIKDAVPLPESFEPSTDEHGRDAGWTSWPFAGREPGWATLAVAGELAATVEESGLEARRNAQGELLVRLPFLDERWLINEVLRYGGRAVLVEPEHVRDRIAGAAAELLSLYKSEDPHTQPDRQKEGADS